MREASAPFSMLADDALDRIRAFALAARGAVIEVGTYVGGTTAVLIRALADNAGGKLICIEAGGQHFHPTCPSSDIIGDWHVNMARMFGESLPVLIEGNSWLPAVTQAVSGELGTETCGMIVFDADGFPALTLIEFGRFLRQDCLLVVDDYVSSTGLAGNKTLTLKRQIDHGLERGELEQYGVYGHGTWFGCLRKPLASYRLGLIHASKNGFAHVERIPSSSVSWRLYDDAGTDYVRCSPEDVIAFGDGRYATTSDSGGAMLYFAPPGNPAEILQMDFELSKCDA